MENKNLNERELNKEQGECELESLMLVKLFLYELFVLPNDGGQSALDSKNWTAISQS